MINQPTPPDEAQRTVLITGATGAIGGACARALAADGWRVVGTSRRPPDDRSTVTEWLMWDMVDSPTPPDFGPVDAVVHAAGSLRPGLITRATEEHFDHAFRLHLVAAARLIGATIGAMALKGWGRVVLVSAAAADVGGAGLSVYASSKSAQVGLARSVTREYAARGITCNVVSPGFIDSPLLDSLPRDARTSYLERIPARRLGRPEEVAAVISLLLSDRGGYINGAVIPVDGGLAMGR